MSNADNWKNALELLDDQISKTKRFLRGPVSGLQEYEATLNLRCFLIGRAAVGLLEGIQDGITQGFGMLDDGVTCPLDLGDDETPEETNHAN